MLGPPRLGTVYLTHSVLRRIAAHFGFHTVRSCNFDLRSHPAIYSSQCTRGHRSSFIGCSSPLSSQDCDPFPEDKLDHRPYHDVYSWFGAFDCCRCLRSLRRISHNAEQSYFYHVTGDITEMWVALLRYACLLITLNHQYISTACSHRT